MSFASTYSSRKYPLVLFGLWLAGAIVLILWSMRMSDGHLIYTLDDPYIHLAVAQNILHGGYGINSAEYSAPSSSMAYPFLLALTEWAGLADWGPLAINMLAMAGAVYVVGHIIEHYVLIDDGKNARSVASKIVCLGLGLSACLVMNAWGLVMTGMEHSLHVLAVVLVAWGFLKSLAPGAKPPAWLVMAIVALPLIRFEGLAMALVSVAGLLYLGHRRTALVAGLLLLLALFGWFQFTRSLGLPALPSSVLLKSGIAANVAEHGGLSQLGRAVLRNLYESLKGRQGVLLLLGMVVMTGLSWFRWRKGDRSTAVVMGGLAAATGMAHVFFGQYGWFSRYEIYAFALVMISGLVLGRVSLIRSSVRIGVVFTLLVVAAPYAFDTLRTPSASRNIYQQQYQMHRFAADYWKRPVAVNDLGWVSYGNPNFVLDLWGLGSEEVRRLRLAGTLNAQTLTALADHKNVALAMIYADWFKGTIPIEWQKVAVLNTSQVSAASGKVDFYLTPRADRSQALDLLRQFGGTLPKGAWLDMSMAELDMGMSDPEGGHN